MPSSQGQDGRWPWPPPARPFAPGAGNQASADRRIAYGLVRFIAVLLVMAVSVTLLPAILGFAGTGIDRLRVGRRRRVPDPAKGFWWAWCAWWQPPRRSS